MPIIWISRNSLRRIISRIPKLIGADTILFIPDADQIIDDVMSAVGEMESAKKIAKKEGKTSEPKTRKGESTGDKVHGDT